VRLAFVRPDWNTQRFAHKRTRNRAENTAESRATLGDRTVDIGLYWAPAVLEHKLERRHLPAPVEEIWNCRRMPTGLGQTDTSDRLVIASGGRWIGYFRLVPEVLYTPAFALIFDASTWTALRTGILCKPFRGWTYKVPAAVFATPTVDTGNTIT
jgi:hypothetical protein